MMPRACQSRKTRLCGSLGMLAALGARYRRSRRQDRHQMGRATIKNGELLALAEEQFDVFVTVDRNLTFQQNLAALSIAVVVLHAKTNRLADLRPLVPKVLAPSSPHFRAPSKSLPATDLRPTHNFIYPGR